MPSWLIKLILIGLVVGAVTGAISFYGYTRYNAGYKDAMDDVTEATQKAEKETREKQADIQKKVHEVRDEIKRNTDGDRRVSPVIGRELKRLRTND